VFRRDQIWFTDKDRYGATKMYSLAEYAVRSDASFEKDYLAGKYGAVPSFMNFKKLFTSNMTK
jgi:AAA15 family ATPase/GTPase